jgi:hypothetical protein
MDSKKEINLEEYVDQRRWLLNNGLITDDIKNQLFLCGSIVHKEVQAVELDLDLTNEQKIVNYTIYVESDLIKKIAKYEVLSKSTSLIGMWRFKRLLKKEGSLDFQQILSRFVKDFCGPKWSVTIKIVDFNTYVEGLGDQSETDGRGQQFNQLSD